MHRFFIFIAGISFASCGFQGSNPNPNTSDHANGKVIFDIPVLLNKNIDEIIQELGKSTYQLPDFKKTKEGSDLESTEEIYVKDGYLLVISYNTKSRIVYDFYLQTKNKIDKGQEYANFLSAMHLDPHNTHYSIQPIVDRGDAGFYAAITVAKK